MGKQMMKNTMTTNSYGDADSKSVYIVVLTAARCLQSTCITDVNKYQLALTDQRDRLVV